MSVITIPRGVSAYSMPDYTSVNRDTERSVFTSFRSDSLATIWRTVTDELLRIRDYKDDWDGEGTYAPQTTVVDAALRLSQHLMGLGVTPPEHVHAGVNGTIYLEWSSPVDSTEIEVVGSQEAVLTIIRHGSKLAEMKSFSFS